MGENSNIAWTDHSMNFWIGCTEVGPACNSCYARELAKRYQWGVDPRQAEKNRALGIAPGWGPGVPRHRTSANNWLQPLRWNAAAQRRGRPAKVFTNSLADFFDNEVPSAWRIEAYDVMRRTPWLRWIVLTKRLPLVRKMLPPDWGDGFPNVGIMTSVCDQEEYERDAPRLMAIEARWRGFSIEPQIGRVDIDPARYGGATGSWWFIVGGESEHLTAGLRARPWNPEWARTVFADCNAVPGLYPFMKQTGARPIGLGPFRNRAGEDPLEWPAWLRRREFPPELLN